MVTKRCRALSLRRASGGRGPQGRAQASYPCLYPLACGCAPARDIDVCRVDGGLRRFSQSKNHECRHIGSLTAHTTVHDDRTRHTRPSRPRSGLDVSPPMQTQTRNARLASH